MRPIGMIFGLVIVVFAGRVTVAGNCECKVHCPRCDYVCKMTCEKEQESKHCWNVECKPICVPQVRLPWEKCCQPRCAKVKYVKVLKKHEYECARCKYKFEPVHHGDCIGGTGCAADAPDASARAEQGPQYQLPVPPVFNARLPKATGSGQPSKFMDPSLGKASSKSKALKTLRQPERLVRYSMPARTPQTK